LFIKALENHISSKRYLNLGRKMSEKPTTGFIFSLIGGIFVLLGGLLWSVVGTLLTIFFGIGFLLYAFLIFGIIIIVGALMMNSNPKSAHTWGIVVIILGVLSLIGITTTLGGILSIVGGALALSWNPSRATAQNIPPPQGTTRFCQNCGGPLTFVQEYQRWYCTAEQKYV
jgi:hypothetical protein